MDDKNNDDLKNKMQGNLNEILKNFYSEKNTPEGRKFLLLMMSKFMPSQMKRDSLKRLIDNLDEAGIDAMFSSYLDLFCSDNVAEFIRSYLDDPEHQLANRVIEHLFADISVSIVRG